MNNIVVRPSLVRYCNGQVVGFVEKGSSLPVGRAADQRAIVAKSDRFSQMLIMMQHSTHRSITSPISLIRRRRVLLRIRRIVAWLAIPIRVLTITSVVLWLLLIHVHHVCAH